MKRSFMMLTLAVITISALSVSYSQAFLFNWFGGGCNNCYSNYDPYYYEPYGQEYNYSVYSGPYMYY